MYTDWKVEWKGNNNTNVLRLYVIIMVAIWCLSRCKILCMVWFCRNIDSREKEFASFSVVGALFCVNFWPCGKSLFKRVSWIFRCKFIWLMVPSVHFHELPYLPEETQNMQNSPNFRVKCYKNKKNRSNVSVVVCDFYGYAIS